MKLTLYAQIVNILETKTSQQCECDMEYNYASQIHANCSQEDLDKTST